MSAGHIPLLEKLIELGRAAQISLRYTTNGTLPVQRYFEMWKHFQDVSLSISIDGVDGVYEYIRSPASWVSVKNNVAKMDDEIGRSISRVSIQPTPNVFNISNLIELSNWTLNNLRNVGWTDHLNFQEGPSWQSAYILDLSDKLKLKKTFEDYSHVILAERSKDPRVPRIKRWFESLATKLLLKNWQNLQEEFRRKNLQLDQIRNESLKDSIPMTYNLLFKTNP